MFVFAQDVRGHPHILQVRINHGRTLEVLAAGSWKNAGLQSPHLKDKAHMLVPLWYPEKKGIAEAKTSKPLRIYGSSCQALLDTTIMHIREKQIIPIENVYCVIDIALGPDSSYWLDKVNEILDDRRVPGAIDQAASFITFRDFSDAVQEYTDQRAKLELLPGRTTRFADHLRKLVLDGQYYTRDVRLDKHPGYHEPYDPQRQVRDPINARLGALIAACTGVSTGVNQTVIENVTEEVTTQVRTTTKHGKKSDKPEASREDGRRKVSRLPRPIQRHSQQQLAQAMQSPLFESAKSRLPSPVCQSYNPGAVVRKVVPLSLNRYGPNLHERSLPAASARPPQALESRYRAEEKQRTDRDSTGGPFSLCGRALGKYDDYMKREDVQSRSRGRAFRDRGGQDGYESRFGRAGDMARDGFKENMAPEPDQRGGTRNALRNSRAESEQMDREGWETKHSNEISGDDGGRVANTYGGMEGKAKRGILKRERTDDRLGDRIGCDKRPRRYGTKDGGELRGY